MSKCFTISVAEHYVLMFAAYFSFFLGHLFCIDLLDLSRITTKVISFAVRRPPLTLVDADQDLISIVQVLKEMLITGFLALAAPRLWISPISCFFSLEKT